jgi:hypothetical protein
MLMIVSHNFLFSFPIKHFPDVFSRNYSFPVFTMLATLPSLLQIVNQKDPNWWQAKKVGSNGPAGLIPSQELEERRKAFVKPEADYVHKIGICGTRVCYKFILLSW